MSFIRSKVIIPLSSIFVDPIRDLRRKQQRKKYIKRLEYALSRLMFPYHRDVDDTDLEYRAEAVRWLIAYYNGQHDAVADGPPELKLKKTLSKPSRDITVRDHVLAKVLYYWAENHRVEGF